VLRRSAEPWATRSEARVADLRSATAVPLGESGDINVKGVVMLSSFPVYVDLPAADRREGQALVR
jgi:hypothetical protein